MHILRLVGILAACLSSHGAMADSFQMDKLETEDLRLLYFDPPQTYLTPHVGRSFHNSMAFQKEIFDWTPWDKTTLLLKDFTDYGNAAARSSPNNAMVIDVAPLSRTFETFTASERVYALMNHELVHVATMDVWNKADDRWRKFFHGKPMPEASHPESILYNYLATPRVRVPRWYLEGSAVFLETWMGGGIGRAQGAYDEMVFRAMVRDGAHFYSPLGLVSEGTKIDFQGGTNAYLYGTRFMSYMALTRSPDLVINWLKRGEGSKRYYSSQFKQIFGQELDAAWNDWIAWERAFQLQNLKDVRTFPITPAEQLTSRALGSISRSYIDPESGNLIGAFRYPGVVAHVGILSTSDGTIRHLSDIKGPMNYRVTSLAFDPSSRRIWFTADNYNFRDIMEIDLATGKTRMLIEDARIGDLVFSKTDKTLWGIRHLNGLATLVRLTDTFETWNQVHTFDYGQVPYDLDISPDGTLISMSMGEISGKQTLRIYKTESFLAGNPEETGRFDVGTAVPEGFVFSPGGDYLFGSSYYTGASNIFRYEVANGNWEGVSNTETGFFRPIPRQDGSLIVFEYTGQGFRPVTIDPVPLEDVSAVKFLGNEVVTTHPAIKEWAVGSPKDVPLEDLITDRTDYKPAHELRLGSAYPVIEGYQGYGAIGWHFNIEDPMQFHRLMITASYTPDDAVPANERFHAQVEYNAISWYARYRHNGADFYDLFGPTEKSRKGNAFMVGYEKAVIYDKPRELTFNADAAHYTGLDTLPGNQNIQATATDITTADLSLKYTNTRKSIGNVDHEKGFRWDVATHAARTSEETIEKLQAGLDFGLALPWHHSSLWLYNSGGVSHGSPANPLTNHYFGGFGNNFVDDGDEKRYRHAGSLPGFEIDEISAGDYIKSVAEWNLPPLRFRKIGTPALYLEWMRPAVFTSTLVTDPGTSIERNLANVGAQLDFHFTLAHGLPMILSIGYAAGFESGDKHSEEAMISLKIL